MTARAPGSTAAAPGPRPSPSTSARRLPTSTRWPNGVVDSSPPTRSTPSSRTGVGSSRGLWSVSTTKSSTVGPGGPARRRWGCPARRSAWCGRARCPRSSRVAGRRRQRERAQRAEHREAEQDDDQGRQQPAEEAKPGGGAPPAPRRPEHDRRLPHRDDSPAAGSGCWSAQARGVPPAGGGAARRGCPTPPPAQPRATWMRSAAGHRLQPVGDDQRGAAAEDRLQRLPAPRAPPRGRGCWWPRPAPRGSHRGARPGPGPAAAAVRRSAAAPAPRAACPAAAAGPWTKPAAGGDPERTGAARPACASGARGEQVLPHRSGEEERLLGDQRGLGAERGHGAALDVDAVPEEPSCVRTEEAEQQRRRGCSCHRRSGPPGR